MLKKVLLVWANKMAKEEFLSRTFPPDFEVIFMNVYETKNEIPAPVAYFILDESLIKDFPFDDLDNGTPIFINDVLGTLDSLPTGKCLIRINAWPGFLSLPLLELASHDNDQEAASRLLVDLQWPFRWVADITGMVTPRVVAMIINEACFAVNQHISSPTEIDIALKLGTSYPRGPFEWAKQIGPLRIIQLLTALSAVDERYTPAPFIHENLQRFS